MRILRIVLIAVILSMISQVAMGKEKATSRTDSGGYTIYDRAVLSVARDVVPKRFLNAFIFYTEERKHLRVLFLAQSDQESSCFRDLVSRKPNSNGSIDRGPLGLNSYNIKSADFMATYAPKGKFKDKDIYYMVTCMNFMEAIIKSHDGDVVEALIEYNAGWKVFQPESWELYQTVYRNYAMSVMNYVNRYENMALKREAKIAMEGYRDDDVSFNHTDGHVVSHMLSKTGTQYDGKEEDTHLTLWETEFLVLEGFELTTILHRPLENIVGYLMKA